MKLTLFRRTTKYISATRAHAFLEIWPYVEHSSKASSSIYASIPSILSKMIKIAITAI